MIQLHNHITETMADIVFIVDEAESLVTAFLLQVDEIYQTLCAPKMNSNTSTLQPYENYPSITTPPQLISTILLHQQALRVEV